MVHAYEHKKGHDDKGNVYRQLGGFSLFNFCNTVQQYKSMCNRLQYKEKLIHFSKLRRFKPFYI